MEENRGKKDFRKVRSANSAMMFRILCICAVLYWLAELVVAYFRGGPDAPDLTLLIVAAIVLGGGAILVAILTWKAWKVEKEAASLSEEEVAELEAMREDEE